MYSSRFQTEDFGEEDKFDPKVLPQSYLTDPQPGHAFVYVCTIQRMAINILGRQAIFGGVTRVSMTMPLLSTSRFMLSI